MDPVELEATYTEEGNISYAYGENDDDDYPGSEDNQSGEDGDANRESDDADEALNNASVDDMDSELSDDVASDSSPIASSDDEWEDEEEAGSETISVENNDSGSDGEAKLIDEEFVDTVSDKSSLDSEANNTSEEGATVTTAARFVGEIVIYDKESTTYQEHDNISTSARTASRGWAQSLKGQSARSPPAQTTHQAYQPINNDQPKNTYQSFNNHRTADENRKKIPRSLPETPTLLDTSSLHQSQTSAGVQKPTGSKRSAFKKLKDTVLKSTIPGTTEASSMICRKSKGKQIKLPVQTTRHRAPEKMRKSEFSNDTDGIHELYVPDESAQPMKVTKMPESAKHSSVVHEMESMPVVTATHSASKTKQQPMIHELEEALAHVHYNSKQNFTIHELDAVIGQTPKITRKYSTVHELDSGAIVSAGLVPSRTKKQPVIHELEGVARRVPKNRKPQPTVCEMDGMPVRFAKHLSQKTGQQSPLYEMEDIPMATTNRTPTEPKDRTTTHELDAGCEVASSHTTGNSRKQPLFGMDGALLTNSIPIFSRTNSPSIAASDTSEPWIPTSFSNPPKILLNGIFAGVLMRHRNSTRSMFDHDSHVIIGFSLMDKYAKEYVEVGMQKYKTSKEGFTLWWKPYSPSADYYDSDDEDE
ncbi:uncharacterized protein J4E78_000126 [Alternaria triticimaculans]|uniref:uncharacterized protein n=1 Tax=Alternaria triticimaculans TaxID=297637 RepID=UPI0020C3D05F|nr:uncharacterized protein J4E78_000126 [Alternaria triticimaculans]KAI4671630.1 hypothetical protein J4E78_000126 [Alternaria triticimaculans]